MTTFESDQNSVHVPNLAWNVHNYFKEYDKLIQLGPQPPSGVHFWLLHMAVHCPLSRGAYLQAVIAAVLWYQETLAQGVVLHAPFRKKVSVSGEDYLCIAELCVSEILFAEDSSIMHEDEPWLHFECMECEVGGDGLIAF